MQAAVHRQININKGEIPMLDGREPQFWAVTDSGSLYHVCVLEDDDVLIVHKLIGRDRFESKVEVREAERFACVNIDRDAVRILHSVKEKTKRFRTTPIVGLFLDQDQAHECVESGLRSFDEMKSVTVETLKSIGFEHPIFKINGELRQLL